MKKKGFVFTVIAIGLGLVGLLCMQGYFLYDSYRLKSQLFDQSVNTVLQTVAAKLEKGEVLQIIKTRINPIIKIEKDSALKLPPPPPKEKKHKRIKHHKSVEEVKIVRSFAPEPAEWVRKDSLFNSPRVMVFTPQGDEMIYTHPKRWRNAASKFKVLTDKQRRVIVRVGPEGKIDTSIILFHSQNIPPHPPMPPNFRNQHELRIEQRISTVDEPEDVEKDKLVRAWIDSVSRFKKRIEVFERIAAEADVQKRSLLDRVKPHEIDSLLKNGFKQAGVDLDFQFSLTNDSSKVVYKTVSTKQNTLQGKDNCFQTTLFPQDVLHNAGILTVVFPDKADFIMEKMGVIIIASSLIVLVIMACFGVTIAALLRQKKLSEMKSDFINNMTHEFKTPVATIMLASEALRDEQMAADKTMVSRYAGIIYDENLRLSSYVERVLSLARLEKSDLRLDRKPVVMHDLISAVADSMDLQFRRRNAQINFDFQATESVILGDELHLNNVIFNLLDNALKYSAVDPKIIIATQNLGDLLLIRVTDNGIGMTREQQSRVFDQFYRAHTGNLHNVKGFGLGLNYVYSIIKLLKGNISVKSEPQKGSTFELSFTLN
ncbi:sensor histidine kinase [Solitalea lacus]|uniref:sensor histidine kinase n=1 Tax=Solitalea lacus TaxID=2911172 RepID=UPI001EDA7428|nr:HAMP domain-containing sensor histidine kinase [Solitalea lacus]UKJ08022.1 HAMP domain-containing histidine kinase [Solitalea lacus]